MSYKIYTGLKLEGNCTVVDLMNKLNEVKIDINNVFQYEYDKVAGEFISFFLDSKFVLGGREIYEIANDVYELDNIKGEIKSFSVFTMLSRLIEKDENTYLGGFPRDFNFKCTLNIYAIEGKILIYPVFVKNSYWSILLKHFDEYVYYNDSDKPKNISEEEWDQRGNDWCTGLDSANRALVFELVDTRSNMSVKKLLDYIESIYEDRIRFLLDLKFGSKLKDSNEETKKEIKEFESNIRKELPRSYTIKDLSKLTI